MTLEMLLPQLQFDSIIEVAVKQKIIKNRKQIEAIAETAYSSNENLLVYRVTLFGILLEMFRFGPNCTINKVEILASPRMMLFGFVTL